MGSATGPISSGSRSGTNWIWVWTAGPSELGPATNTFFMGPATDPFAMSANGSSAGPIFSGLDIVPNFSLS